MPIVNFGTAAENFTFSGSGALNLTGTSTYTGPTILNGGTTTLSTAAGQLSGTGRERVDVAIEEGVHRRG